MADHVRGEGHSGEVVGLHQGVVVDRYEGAGTSAVGYLAHSDGSDGARCHGVGTIPACDVVHRPEGQVAVDTCIGRSVVDNLERAEPVGSA